MERVHDEGRDGRWWLAVVVVPAVLLVVTLALPAVFAGRLPTPLATHWGTGMRPDGSMSLGALFLLQLVIVGGVWGVLVGYGWRSMPPSPSVFTAYFLLGLFLAAQVSIVVSNLDAAGWQQADRLSNAVLVVVIVVAAVAGGVGFLASGGTSNLMKPEDRTADPGR